MIISRILVLALQRSRGQNPPVPSKRWPPLSEPWQRLDSIRVGASPAWTLQHNDVWRPYICLAAGIVSLHRSTYGHHAVENCRKKLVYCILYTLRISSTNAALVPHEICRGTGPPAFHLGGVPPTHKISSAALERYLLTSVDTSR